MRIPEEHQINWLGMWTLYSKEVRRFMRVYHQTLLAPMVTSMLFLAIFSLAIGGRVDQVAGVPFVQFMSAGLIVMTMMQNAFANTSSSLTMGKVLGSIIDYLLPPLSAREITFAMMMGGVTRGVACGVMVWVAATLFGVAPQLHSLAALVFYTLISCAVLSLLGIIAGIFADTFDQMSAMTSYVITPLAFLSGTFYSVDNLPGFWREVTHFNPFFYMIDGFRYSLTGHHDGSMTVGMVMLALLTVLLYAFAHMLIYRGVRIKA